MHSKCNSSFIASGFCCSKFADKLKDLSEESIVERFLEQLDEMFASRTAFRLMPDVYKENDFEDVIEYRPASHYFLGAIVQDWSKVPYIWGGYSRPASGSTEEIRAELFEPLENRLFFAGEATHPSSFQTLNGAIASAHEVASLILHLTIDFEKHVSHARL